MRINRKYLFRSGLFCLFIFCMSFVSPAQNYYSLAKESYRLGKYQECITYLDSCDYAKFSPDSVLCLRAYIALKNNDPDKATVYCNSLQLVNKHYHELWYLRALTSSMKKKYALATEQYTKFLYKEPAHAHALYNRAWAKGNLEDFESALEDLDLCIKYDPNFSDAYFLRGYWQESLGNYDEAYKDYSRSLEINPDHKEVYVPLAYLMNKKGEKEKACELLQKAIEKGVSMAHDLQENYCK
jgi:tetratricopeptide (TPR) repeat protein